VLGCLAGSGPVAAQAPDPFAAGLRWSHAPSAQEAWLPTSLVFAAGGELVWAAGSGADPRRMLFSTPSGAFGGAEQPPVFEDAHSQPVQGGPRVAGSARADSLFSVVQVPGSDPLDRRAQVARHDALASAAGASFAPRWIHDMGVVASGTPLVAAARDGARVVAAVHDQASGLLRLDWLDGWSGALDARRELASQSLRRLELSDDGARCALLAGAELWVLDAAGATLHHEQLALVTNALALSGDGRTLLVGAGSGLRALVDAGAGFAEAAHLSAPVGEYAVRAAAARDGGTWAIGWWDSLDGRSVRLEVVDGTTHATLFEHEQKGAPGGLQNFPASVRVTPDGRRAAFGLWGANDPRPDVLVYDRASDAVVFARDLAGSALALVLDDEGRRLAVGMKHAHANQFAATGQVRLYDTGECDVALLARPEAGHPLPVAARLAGAKTVLFLVGAPAPSPQTLPGVAGTLLLDRGAGIRAFLAPADASGRADLALSPSPGHFGVELAVQALARLKGGARLTLCAVAPLVL